MNEENIKNITEQFNSFDEEIQKFNEKGVAAAGTRARKALLESIAAMGLIMSCMVLIFKTIINR